MKMEQLQPAQFEKLLKFAPKEIHYSIPYVMDHVVRHFQNKSLQEFLLEAGMEDTDHVILEAGIGTLTMYKDVNLFEPAKRTKTSGCGC